MRLAPVAALLPLTACCFAQNVITTIGGADSYFSRRVQPALEASLGEVSGASVDAQGRVYFCDRRNNLVLRLGTDGTLTVVAGNGLAGFPDRTLTVYLPFAPINPFGGDGGPATRALLNDPTSVAVDRDGTLYIADRINQRIRRVSPAGTITTYAGGGKPASGNGDGGPATAASLSEPFGLALDGTGNLYISDVGANVIRRVAPGGTITTVASSLSYPAHMAVDAGGTLFVAELRKQRIIRIGADGAISAVAGSGQQGFSGDGGAALEAQLNNPAGVAVDAAGVVYIADTGNSRVRRVESGTIRAFAGTGRMAAAGDDGPALQADTVLPTAVVSDGRGGVLIVSARVGKLRRVRPDGVIETIAGSGRESSFSEDGLATNVPLRFSIDATCQGYTGEPRSLSTYPSLATDAAGNVYFAEPTMHRVRRITPAGLLETVAGNGTAGLSGDGGPARNASLNGPVAVATGPGGLLFIADINNERVRFVDGSGTIRTAISIASGGGQSLSASNLQLDGFLSPRDRIIVGIKMAVDPVTAALYIAFGRSIFRVTPAGTVTSFVPQIPPRTPAFPAGNQAYALAFDSAGALYAATDRQVFRLAADGAATLVAGTGAFGNAGDGGPATAATLSTITGITFDGADNLYISDWSPTVVRRVTPNGMISRLAGVGAAGSGACGNSGDGGPATSAKLDPRTVAADRNGRILIMSGDRIRAVLTQPPAFAASASTLSFSGSAGGPPARPQELVLTTTVTGVTFTARVEPDTARWLRLSATSGEMPRVVTVTADPADLPQGRHEATIVLDAPAAAPGQIRIAVTFEVGAALPPKLVFDRDALTFFVPRSSAARTRVAHVRNVGGGEAAFELAISYNGPGGWLSLNPPRGTVSPRPLVSIAVTADPAGLAPRTYTAAIGIMVNGARVARLPVILILSEREQVLSLTQAGLSFTAVQEGGVVPPQTFGLANSGAGRVGWSVAATTESGGTQWLRAAPNSGATIAGEAVSEVDVQVDAAGLAPGRYYGLVTVRSADAANSPQVTTASLEVLERGSNPGAVAVPGELLFQASAGGEFTSSQDLLLYNLSGAPVSYRASVSLSPGKRWLRVAPLDGTIDPREPLRLAVQPLLRDIDGGATLAPGEYSGVITLQFSDGVVRSVPLRYTVTATPAGRSAEGCSATSLKLAWRAIGPAFGGLAGWPMAMDAEVRDDCGEPLESGSVVVSFSNGDPPVGLQSLRGGRWQGTWQASTRPEQVVVRAEASNPSATVKGTLETPAVLRNSQDPPQFSADAVVSAAAAAAFSPLAPRGMISIYGQGLAESTQTAGAVPLPSRLGNTEVIMGGRVLPLIYASAGQINAVVPEDLAVDTVHQVFLRRGVTLSQPVPVNVAAAQPALFSSDGRAVAAAVRNEAGGQRTFAPVPESPARAGDTLVLFASGLGDVGGTLAAGAASPADPVLRVRNPVQVRIGDRDAAVSFAGLTPAFVALYQINAVVPEGITPGDAVAVTVSTGGQMSPAATIAVR